MARWRRRGRGSDCVKAVRQLATHVHLHPHFQSLKLSTSNLRALAGVPLLTGRLPMLGPCQLGPDEKIVYTNPNIWTGYTYSNDTVHTLLTCLVIDSKVVCDSFDNLQF